MTRTDLAAIVLAAAWTGFVLCTRNGRHAAHVILIAAHRRLVRATGQHGLDQPAGVRDVLRDIGLSAAWHMPRYWWWRDRAARAVRGCLHWPAGQMSRPEMLRAPVAASAPGDGPAPVASPSRAGPLTSLPDGEHPYPLALTAPQPALRELLEPLPAARPYVPEYLP